MRFQIKPCWTAGLGLDWEREQRALSHLLTLGFPKSETIYRERVPRGTITSDIIVGFPGETQEDFEATLRVMKEARYDNIYLFKYSPRPGTPAFSMPDPTPEEAKTERFQEAQRLQREISETLHRELEGTTVEVMVEGSARRKPGGSGSSGDSLIQIAVEQRFTGRSRGYHRVQFLTWKESPRAGSLVEVRVERGRINALEGVALPSNIVLEEAAS